MRPLTTTRVYLLVEHFPCEHQALVILAAGNGLRQGKALRLTRDWLRLLGKVPVVRVDRQLVTRPGGKTEFAPPKTTASNRTVPLPRVVIDALNTHVAEFNVAESGLLLQWQGSRSLGSASGSVASRRPRRRASPWRPALACTRSVSITRAC